MSSMWANRMISYKQISVRSKTSCIRKHQLNVDKYWDKLITNSWLNHRLKRTMSFSNECIEKSCVTTSTVIIEKKKNVSENETEVFIFFENEIEVKSRHSIINSQNILQIMKRQNAEIYWLYFREHYEQISLTAVIVRAIKNVDHETLKSKSKSSIEKLKRRVFEEYHSENEMFLRRKADELTANRQDHYSIQVNKILSKSSFVFFLILYIKFFSNLRLFVFLKRCIWVEFQWYLTTRCRSKSSSFSHSSSCSHEQHILHLTQELLLDDALETFVLLALILLCDVAQLRVVALRENSADDRLVSCRSDLWSRERDSRSFFRRRSRWRTRTSRIESLSERCGRASWSSSTDRLWRAARATCRCIIDTRSWWR